MANGNVLKRLFDKYCAAIDFDEELLKATIRQYCANDRDRKEKAKSDKSPLRDSNATRQLQNSFSIMILIRFLEVMEVKEFKLGVKAKNKDTGKRYYVEVTQVFHEGEYKHPSAINNPEGDFLNSDNILKAIFFRMLNLQKITVKYLLDTMVKNYCKPDENDSGRRRTIGNTKIQLVSNSYTIYIFMLAMDVICMKDVKFVLKIKCGASDDNWMTFEEYVTSISAELESIRQEEVEEIKLED